MPRCYVPQTTVLFVFYRKKKHKNRLFGSIFKRQSMSMIVKKRNNSARWLFQSVKPWNITTVVEVIRKKQRLKEPRKNMD